MQNTPSYDISGGSSGDSGHVSETDISRSTRINTKKQTTTMRRGSTPGTESRNQLEPSKFSSGSGSNLVSSRRTSSSKNSGIPRQGSMSSVEYQEATTNGYGHYNRVQDSVHFQAQPSRRGPEIRGGARNSSYRNVGSKSQASRRNSIGCTYQIWRLAGQAVNGPHDNVTNSFDVTIDSSAFADTEQQPVLPPLTARGPRQSDVKITVRGGVTIPPRRRNNSGPERSFLQSSRSDERRSSLSPIPPNRKVAPQPKDRRSASVDYSLQKPDLRPTLVSGRKSPYRNAPRRNDSAEKLSFNDHQDTFILSRTASPHTAGDRVVKKNYPVVSSTPQALGPLASESGAESTIVSRPQSRKLRGNFRSTSVYSPSSGGSAERPSDRMVFVGKRRASLPNTALFGNFDANRSPEFYKTFNELRNGLSTGLDPRDIMEQRTTSARSASTVNSYKEQALQAATSSVVRRDQLQRIEETPHDSSTPGQSIEITKPGELLKPQAPGSGLSSAMDRLKLTEQTCDDSAFVEGNDDEQNDDETPHKKARESLPQEPPGSTENKPKSKSLFHVPGPGKRRVESQLKETTEISRNEENRHFVVGAATGVATEQTSDYFKDVYGDEQDLTKTLIDQALLDEPDDDLCEEDFQQKRIIRWLLGVQTGGMAEQVVRERTPPPSPEPNQQTAIVVVYNGDQNTR